MLCDKFVLQCFLGNSFTHFPSAAVNAPICQLKAAQQLAVTTADIDDKLATPPAASPPPREWTFAKTSRQKQQASYQCQACEGHSTAGQRSVFPWLGIILTAITTFTSSVIILTTFSIFAIFATLTIFGTLAIPMPTFPSSLAAQSSPTELASPPSPRIPYQKGWLFVSMVRRKIPRLLSLLVLPSQLNDPPGIPHLCEGSMNGRMNVVWMQYICNFIYLTWNNIKKFIIMHFKVCLNVKTSVSFTSALVHGT